MAAGVRLAKQLLRKEVKARVAALSDDEKLRQSSIGVQLLFDTAQWAQSERVSVFLSMRDEVRTDEIVRAALAHGKHCFVPRYVGPRMEMLRLRSAQDYETLPETEWKIKQPANNDDSREEAMATGGLDLIIVPGLAFSPQGQRLGRGKGYYDTYLCSCREKQGKRPSTVALAFKEQIYESIPVLETDELVDLVLYERQPS